MSNFWYFCFLFAYLNNYRKTKKKCHALLFVLLWKRKVEMVLQSNNSITSSLLAKYIYSGDAFSRMGRRPTKRRRRKFSTSRSVIHKKYNILECASLFYGNWPKLDCFVIVFYIYAIITSSFCFQNKNSY